MGRKIILTIDKVINNIVLTIIVVALAFAGYALWDSNQIYLAADKSHYEVYKPAVYEVYEEGKSFDELRAINPEVFAWLTVYGTNIDYPVTQGPDNMKYVNTNAEGLYSLSGSIFLDYQNDRSFSDFNSILYGHHMEKKTMFGEIGFFSDKEFFEAHKYGNLYYDGKNHGIEFFAFVHSDAYDGAVFSANINGEETQEVYLEGLLNKATHRRDIGVSKEDHIILLTTCSSASTNGRDILAGRITDEVYDDPFINIEAAGNISEQPDINIQGCLVKDYLLWLPLLTLIVISRLIYIPVKYIINLANSRYKRMQIIR